MIAINIIIAGVERGPFSEVMVRQYLSQGILLPTDSARLNDEAESLPVTDLLKRLEALRPTEKCIKKKKKTSLAKQRSRHRKLLIVGAYLTLALLIALGYTFQDELFNIFNEINTWLYEEWTTVAL